MSKMRTNIGSRVHDDVSGWVKSIQKKVSEVGDAIIEDAKKCCHADKSKQMEFVKNEEFLQTLAKESLGYLKLKELVPAGDLRLDFINPISSLSVGSVIDLRIVTHKDAKDSPPELDVCVMFDEKPVDLSRSSWSSCSFKATHQGSYVVSAKLYGQHIKDSPLTLPVSNDAKACLEKLGLVPAAAAEPSKPLEQEVCSVTDPLVGTKCFAKWSEDNIFYNAEIESVETNGFNVLFYDYGNSDFVKTEDVVFDSSKIPEDAEKDENIVVNVPESLGEGPTKPEVMFHVNDMVIAKWSEDDVWYNAKILEVVEGGFRVIFVDYGNEDVVSKVVRMASEIPREDDYDENVECSNEVAPTAVDAQKDESSSLEVKSSEEKDPVSLDKTLEKETYKVGDLLICKWSEDGVYYNAKILSFIEDKVAVHFIDYGNVAEEPRENLFRSVHLIPPGQEEFIDDCVSKEPGSSKSENEIPVPEIVEDQKLPNVVTSASVEVVPKDLYKVDDLVICKWSEDGIYYNAKILSIDQNKAKVNFVDYGNVAEEPLENLFDTYDKIPPDQADFVDECVSKVSSQEPAEETSQEPQEKANETTNQEKILVEESHNKCSAKNTVNVGDLVICKWSADGIYYNAKILSIEQNKAKVNFVDYGNDAEEPLENLFDTYDQIPPDQADFVDECVSRLSDVKGPNSIDCVKEGSVESNSLPVNQSQPNEHIATPPQLAPEPITLEESSDQSKREVPSTDKGLQVGSVCLAKWMEDDTWYNAKILEISGNKYKVIFVDYGNEDTVTQVVAKVTEIPSGEVSDEHITPPPGVTVEVVQEAKEPSAAVTETRSKIGVSSEISIGSSCIAKWSEDSTWYNAKVVEVHEGGFTVLFVDYGNEDKVSIDNIRMDFSKIPVEDIVDVNVSPVVSPVVDSNPVKAQDALVQANDKKDDNISSTWKVGDHCFAKWSDDVWYRAEIKEICPDKTFLLFFTDYGNEDMVLGCFMVSSAQEIPSEELKDENIKTPSPSGDTTLKNEVENSSSTESPGKDSGTGDSMMSVAPKTNFLHYLEKAQDNLPQFTAKKKFVIKNLNGPLGLSLLNDFTLAVCCRNDNTVRKFSKTGNSLGSIQHKTGNKSNFERPTEVCLLKTGEFCVRDNQGIHLFDPRERYLGKLGEKECNQYWGIAEDDQHILTINCNHGVGARGTITEFNQTDIFYFDKVTKQLIKRVEMVHVIDEETRVNSACRYLAVDNDKLYVVDMMKDCIYRLQDEEAGAFGDPGEEIGRFKRPCGIVLDEFGSMIIVDSGNSRLQVVDNNWNFCGNIKVDRPLVRPSGVYFDKENSELYVSNFSENSVVCYQLPLPL